MLNYENSLSIIEYLFTNNVPICNLRKLELVIVMRITLFNMSVNLFCKKT